MIFSLAFVVLANLACIATAAILPSYDQGVQNLVKRTEVTFVWHDYPVQNCSVPELGRSPPEHSILVEDCEWVRTMITSNNGGFFELWNFNSAKYKPIVGYKTCVLAVSHAVTHNSSDYAMYVSKTLTVPKTQCHHLVSHLIVPRCFQFCFCFTPLTITFYPSVGNDDVATIMATVLDNFQKDGYVATVTGNMTCGPDNATLGLLLYNGLTGGSGGPVNASITTMMGDAWGGASGTGKAPALPSVTVHPASSSATPS